MIKEYIIGREGDQKDTIDDKYDAVSRKHARLTINEETGEYRLSDASSRNGTYIIDQKGNMVPVTEEITIQPTTRICLGGNRHNTLVLPAHIVNDGVANGYAIDFNELERKLADWKRREKIRFNWIKIRRILLAFLPVVAFFIPGLGDSGRVYGIIAASAINAVLSGFEKPKKLAEERSRTITCPKCQRALTDKEVERHCCPCGAH